MPEPRFQVRLNTLFVLMSGIAAALAFVDFRYLIYDSKTIYYHIILKEQDYIDGGLATQGPAIELFQLLLIAGVTVLIARLMVTGEREPTSPLPAVLESSGAEKWPQ